MVGRCYFQSVGTDTEAYLGYFQTPPRAKSGVCKHFYYIKFCNCWKDYTTCTLNLFLTLTVHVTEI